MRLGKDMKAIILLTVLFGLIGCSSLKDTAHQAKLDWQNLNNTIQYNSKQPVVLKTAYF